MGATGNSSARAQEHGSVGLTRADKLPVAPLAPVAPFVCSIISQDVSWILSRFMKSFT